MGAPLGCKDIEIIKFELVTKTQFLSKKMMYNKQIFKIFYLGLTVISTKLNRQFVTVLTILK